MANLKEDLGIFIEEGKFLEYMGDIYCVEDSCEGCEHAKECEHETGKVEATENLSVRRAIGVDNSSFSDKFYKQYITSEEFKSGKVQDVNCKWEGDGGLPSSKKVVHKITNLTPSHSEYILYNPEDKENYCIRQVCSKCELFSICSCETVVSDKGFICVATDLRSQEPRMNAFVSKTPQWIDVFQNDSLRGQSEKFVFIDILFRKHPELGIDTSKDKGYWKWLDSMFFFNKTEAYIYNIAVLKLKKEPNNETLREEVIRLSEELVDSFKKFTNRS